MTAFPIWYRSCKRHILVGSSEFHIFSLSHVGLVGGVFLKHVNSKFAVLRHTVQLPSASLVALGRALSHPGAACFFPSSHTCTTSKSFPSRNWGPLSPTTPFCTPTSKISSWSPVALTVARFPCKAAKKNSLKNVIVQKFEKSCSEGTKWVTAALQRMEICPYRLLYGAVKTVTFLCM